MSASTYYYKFDDDECYYFQSLPDSGPLVYSKLTNRDILSAVRVLRVTGNTISVLKSRDVVSRLPGSFELNEKNPITEQEMMWIKLGAKQL